MEFWSRRPSLAVAAGVIVWLASIALTRAQAPAPKPQMSEEAFKNIQVLKGIPVDEFMGTMGLFSAALSVCCAECHTGAGTSNAKWEDDPPRKRTARRMVQMVAAINRDNFNGRQIVTCWTCHRGSQSPLVTPALDRMYGEPVVEPPDILPRATSGEPTVDEIFDKYIQALGGAARLASLTSYVAKGTSTPFGDVVGKGYPTEVYAKAPNQLATIVHQQEGDMARTFDGRAGYFLLPLTVVEEYPWTGGALEGAKLDAELAFPGRIKDFLTNWRVSFSTTLNGVDVRVVQGTAPGLVATFYFDKQSGLLVRMARYTNSSMGRVPTQIDFSDYRPVAGVMMPFKWSYSWVSGREEFMLTEVQPNVAPDPAKFGRPPVTSRPPR
jgi:photosynthetic reaction center cytochrome c subunit